MTQRPGRLTEILQKLAEALDKDQISIEVARRYIADDCIMHQPTCLPFGGDWKGPQGWVDLLNAIKATFPNLQVEYNGMVTNEVDLLAFSGRIRGDTVNGRFDMPLVEFWRFRNGKAIDILPMWQDTKLVSDLLAAR